MFMNQGTCVQPPRPSLLFNPPDLCCHALLPLECRLYVCQALFLPHAHNRPLLHQRWHGPPVLHLAPCHRRQSVHRTHHHHRPGPPNLRQHRLCRLSCVCRCWHHARRHCQRRSCQMVAGAQRPARPVLRWELGECCSAMQSRASALQVAACVGALIFAASGRCQHSLLAFPVPHCRHAPAAASATWAPAPQTAKTSLWGSTARRMGAP